MLFSSTFSLPIEGLSDFSQVPSSILSQMKVKFSLKYVVFPSLQEEGDEYGVSSSYEFGVQGNIGQGWFV